VGTSAQARPTLTVARRGPGEPRILSFQQELLWYLGQLAPKNPAYNGPFLIRLQGELDEAAFQRALDAVVERHEVLRTVFIAPNGIPVPFVMKNRRADLKLIDLRRLPEPEREADAMRLAKQEAAKPFNLARDGMSRSTLFRLSERDYLFLCVIHHIVFEGGSVSILFRDLAAFYNAFTASVAPHSPPLNIDYSDFASWQRNWLQAERLETLTRFWRQRLAGAPVIDIPLDFTRPAVHTMRGAKHSFQFPPGLLATAGAFFRETDTTSYRALCAAFNVFLYCYSGLTDISLGTPCAPRCRGIENLIGFFVNTVVLRIDSSDDPTFRKLIRKVDVALHGAIAHSDLPFSKIVESVQPPRDTSRTPLFQINFRVPQQPYPPLKLDRVTAGPIELIDNGTSKFDLALEIGAFIGEASYFEYCTDLFEERTILQMEADFLTLLAELVAHPDTPASHLSAVREISQRVRPAVTEGSR